MITLYNMAINQIPLLRQVDIKELDDGRIQVRRTKVQPSELLGLAKKKLLIAIECTCKAQQLAIQEEQANLLPALTVSDLLRIDLAKAGYREINPKYDPKQYEGVGRGHLTEALAILQYVAGEQVFQNEFSNFLIEK